MNKDKMEKLLKQINEDPELKRILQNLYFRINQIGGCPVDWMLKRMIKEVEIKKERDADRN
jgi:hypothetical protein